MKIKGFKSKLTAILAASCSACAFAAIATAVFSPEQALAEDGVVGQIGFTQASVTLGEDISMKYFLEVPDGVYESVTGEFTYNGQSYAATLETDSTGDDYFAFDGITPQNMNAPLKLVVTATKADGAADTIEKTYSVKEYCTGALASNDVSEAAKTLVVDLLNYGAAAQVYTEYNAENLVNADLSETDTERATAYEKPLDQYGWQATEGTTPSTNIKWAGARIRYNNAVSVEFIWNDTTNFFTKDSYLLEVTVEGKEPVYIAPEDISAEVGLDGTSSKMMSAVLTGLTSTQFNDKISAKICNNNKEYMSDTGVLTYSVNSFICKKAETEEEKAGERALEQALYCYGKSSVAYKYAAEIAQAEADAILPTYSETGSWGKMYKGYVYDATELPELSSGEYTVTDKTPVTKADGTANGVWTEGVKTFTLISNPNVSFDVEIDHLIQIGNNAYSVYNLPDGNGITGSYDVASDTVTINLDNATVDGGILVWNKSLTLNLTGTNTVSGAAFVNVDRMHTVDGAQVSESLPYAIYVAKSDAATMTKFVGTGTLKVQDMGVRLYGHAEVDGATVNVQVSRRQDGVYSGVTGDIYSEGFKADGTLTLKNGATLKATAATENVDTARMDKAGAVFAALTLSGGSSFTTENFAYGAYMNGGITIDGNSAVSLVGSIRFAAAGDNDITVEAGSSFTASVKANVTNPIEKMHRLTIKKDATASITTRDDNGAEVVLLADANGAKAARKNGETVVDFDAARVLGTDTFAVQYGGDAAKKMSLYVTYSSRNFVSPDGAQIIDVKGYYVYTDAQGTTKFLRFNFTLNGWTSIFNSESNNEGTYDQQGEPNNPNNDGEFWLVYDGVTFRNTAWRGPLLGM